eukprot:CAMPEP_0196825990 /NCGR_PEP_ID=MMETSP1362-20130617/93378_1 /TAXON_ID=163516 /ORGANISM="Leptocylindrus danicus, Strain CCMP1856" /LENGTH=486 /DNA_ID=CAMNT_0042206519 /DNA_START=97 /DNA_END=1554 /DNA_ORIENTATION=+
MTSTATTDDYEHDISEREYGTIASIPSPDARRRHQPGAIAYYPNNAPSLYHHHSSYRTGGASNSRSARHYNRQESGNTTSTGGTGGLIEEVLDTVTDSNWDNQDLTAVKLFPPSSWTNSSTTRTQSASTIGTRATESNQRQLFDCGSTTMSDKSGWTVQTALPTATPIDGESVLSDNQKGPNRVSTSETYVIEEAVLVDEDDSNNHRWLRGKPFWFMFATVIIGIIVAVSAIIISIQSNDNSGSNSDVQNNVGGPNQKFAPSAAPSITQVPSSKPSSKPSTIRAVEMRAKLEEKYINGALLFDDDTTPHAKTLDWLINDDKLQISPEAPNLLQRYVLALLYFTTDGSNWEFSFNWLAPVPECQWREEIGDHYEVISGVYNCSAEGKVTSIELVYNSLIGTIPSELGQLDELEVISLNENKLSGTIPSEIGNLVKLTKLNLEFNSLTGTVPSTVGRLANLAQFWLHYNSITGEMPNEVCVLGIDRLW